MLATAVRWWCIAAGKRTEAEQSIAGFCDSPNFADFGYRSGKKPDYIGPHTMTGPSTAMLSAGRIPALPVLLRRGMHVLLANSRKVTLLAACLVALPAAAELPIDEIKVATMAPPTPYRLYLQDMAISHFIDGKLMIIDGESMQVQGHVALAMAGHATLSPDRSEILVATTYFTKLNRGERIAELQVFDSQTLKMKADINVPSKHAQSFPYRGAVRTSADGRFVYMQNATPATSVTVVDKVAGKFVAEVPTPGCWLIYPAASVNNRFSTLCGDGTMLTVTLDAEGKPASRKKSGKFFDADADALFSAADQDGDNYTFISFKGDVQVVNVGGEEAVPAERWSLLAKADLKGGWRPGGYQPVSLQLESRRMYVTMHAKGKEGSHKNPADEIWAFDLDSKKRVGRVKGHHSTVVAVSRGDAPKVYGLSTEKSTIAVFDGGKKFRHLKTAGPFAEFGTQLDTH